MLKSYFEKHFNEFLKAVYWRFQKDLNIQQDFQDPNAGKKKKKEKRKRGPGLSGGKAEL